MFEVLPGYDEAPMTELAMHLPMFSHGSAFTPDWNNDGVLDLWHHNHYSFSQAESRWSDPSTEKKGPLDGPAGGCMVDWDAVLRDDETGTYYPANEGDGFIDWTDTITDERCFDVHSTSFIDIDGDGTKDLFLTTGGGRGKGKSYVFDNVLFWGEATNSSLGYRLVGGRDAAAAAGLRGRLKNANERGRHQYWIDVDGDGLLDVIFLNYERNDDRVIPGQLYRNVNGRRFEKVKSGETGFAEFAQNMLVTDVDGDGFARELVVPSDCRSRTETSDLPPNQVCDRSPRGSISIYRLEPESLLVRETIEPKPPTHDYVRTISSGDFDSDGLADIATLWGRDVLFHLSSARQQRCQDISDNKEHLKCRLTLGPPDATLHLESCGHSGAVSIRFADFNLDGRLDMLAVCKTPGFHRVYEQMTDGEWREMQFRGEPVDLGALNFVDTMLGGEDFCKGIPVNRLTGLPNNCLARFSPEKCENVRYRHQWLICNNRHKFPNHPNATALGATVADIDNDGYADVIVGYRQGSMVMIRNTLASGPRTRFLTVRLDRAAGAPMAVGAIVKLTASRMGPFVNETTTQLRVLSSLSHETDADGGHDDRLIFGLGRKGRPMKLAVKWPHCCKETVLGGNKAKLWNFRNSMIEPFEVAPPTECDQSCFSPDERRLRGTS